MKSLARKRAEEAKRARARRVADIKWYIWAARRDYISGRKYAVYAISLEDNEVYILNRCFRYLEIPCAAKKSCKTCVTLIFVHPDEEFRL